MQLQPLGRRSDCCSAWACPCFLIVWGIAALVGVILTVLALIMMSGIGPFHLAVREGRMRDPGPAATNFGTLTPLGSLVGHVLYGVVLGMGYQFLPVG